MQSFRKIGGQKTKSNYFKTISMKKYIVLLIVTFFSINTYAQNDFEYAVLKNSGNKEDEMMTLLHARVEELLKGVKEVHLFDWNEQTHKIKYVDELKRPEKPVEIIKFAEMGWINNLKDIDVTLVTDTTGKTKEAYFRLIAGVRMNTKLIEMKTSRIISIKQLNYGPQNRLGVIKEDALNRDIVKVEKFTEEFAGDPAKLRKEKPDAYAKQLAKVREKYMTLMRKRMRELLVLNAENIAKQLGDFESEKIGRAHRVLPDPEATDEKRIKSISFEVSPQDKMRTLTNVLLYEVVDFNGQKSLRYINPFWVSEIGESSGKAAIANIVGKKALAELMRNKAELLIFKSTMSALEYSNRLNADTQEYTVGVRKTCVFCELFYETSLYNLPGMKVVERNAPEIFAFYNLAKSDKFLDAGSEELLNKQLGIKYLFYEEEGRLLATDIETGRVIGSERPQGWLNINYAIALKNLLIETMEKPLRLVRNEDASKGKLKSFIAQSDFGFVFGETLAVYELVDEKVGNKVLKRKQEIGEASFDEPLSDLVAKFKVKKGEKEIWEAQQQGKSLVFEYKLKRQ